MRLPQCTQGQLCLAHADASGEPARGFDNHQGCQHAEYTNDTATNAECAPKEHVSKAILRAAATCD